MPTQGLLNEPIGGWHWSKHMKDETQFGVWWLHWVCDWIVVQGKGFLWVGTMKRIFRTSLKVQVHKLWSFFRLKLGTDVDLACTFEHSSLVLVSDTFKKQDRLVAVKKRVLWMNPYMEIWWKKIHQNHHILKELIPNLPYLDNRLQQVTKI